MRPHPAVPQTVNWHPLGGIPINSISSIGGPPLPRSCRLPSPCRVSGCALPPARSQAVTTERANPFRQVRTLPYPQQLHSPGQSIGLPALVSCT